MVKLAALGILAVAIIFIIVWVAVSADKWKNDRRLQQHQPEDVRAGPASLTAWTKKDGTLRRFHFSNRYEEREGAHAGDQFGTLALSADSETMVITSPFRTSDGVKGTGTVFLYHCSKHNSCKRMYSTTFSVPGAGQHTGRLVRVSADGQVIVLGSPDAASGKGTVDVYVRRLVEEDTWRRVSTLRDKQDNTTGFGTCVSVSPNGTRIAASGNDTRRAQVFHAVDGMAAYRSFHTITNLTSPPTHLLVTNERLLVGTLEEAVVYDRARETQLWRRGVDDSVGLGPTSMASSASGTSAIGIPHINDFRGQVRIHDDDVLIQIIEAPDDESKQRALFGEDLALSQNAKTLVVGCPGIDRVYVYRRENTGEPFKLVQSVDPPPGDTIERAIWSEFGREVSLSADSGVLAISCNTLSDDMPESGAVFVYES